MILHRKDTVHPFVGTNFIRKIRRSYNINITNKTEIFNHKIHKPLNSTGCTLTSVKL